MSINTYQKNIKLKIEVAKRLQYNENVFIDSHLINSNWLNFQKQIENKYNIKKSIYEAYSHVFDLELYKKEDVILFKTNDYAISKDKILITNPEYIDRLAFLNIENKYQFVFIQNDQLKNINVNEDCKISNVFKFKKVISNAILKSLNENFSKIEVLINKSETIISKYKNNKKIIDKINVDSALEIGNFDDFFKEIQQMIKPNIENKFNYKYSIIDNKIIIKSEIIGFDYLSLFNKNKDKEVLQEIKLATEKSKGLIFVGGKKGMGKTSFIKGLKSLIEEKEFNREIKFIENEDELDKEIYADIVLIDINNPLKKIEEIMNLSLMGALVIVSITSQNSIHTLKMIKYKTQMDKNLFSDELIGIYHQTIIPEANQSIANEVSAFDLREYKTMLNYANRPNPNDIILTEAESDNAIPKVNLVSEWLETSDLIKFSLSDKFDEKEIMIDQRSKEWLDMSEKALLLLKNKKITINDFVKNLNLF